MKTMLPPILLCFVVIFTHAQTPEQKILELDLGWEKAQLNADVAFLDNLIAKDFVWVHDHAGLIDGKEAVLNRAKKIQAGEPNNTKGRVARDQKVVILENTAIVYGYTVVDRGPKPTTYHFMRTYVLKNGKYQLLANHTMAIPEEALKAK